MPSALLLSLIPSIAEAVLSYVIDQLDPAETLKTWLKRDPAKLAFQKALARTYAAFARQYPEYVASLFDQSFLGKEAIPEISKLLIRSQHPDSALLAQAWGRSIGFDTHSEFCKRATKPASDFLAWLEAELKAEQAFLALFDSRALDSLPRIEAEIEKLTKELTRGLAAALKIASEYERITLKVEGDINDSNVIVGDGNQINVSHIYNTYYTGAFDTLNDLYVSPDAVFQRIHVDEFVGRDWLTAKVDAFLNDPNRKSGAFLLIGEAGVGKTSFMAHLVKERRYLHLFAEQVTGDANLQRALQSVGSQLVTHYQIDPYKDRDTLTQLAVFPDFLERLLRLAASTLTNGEKIVIVCDALDEAGTFPDGNVFGLPNVLPDGVYFILSQRPVNTKLPNFEPLRFNLEAQGADNLQDMQTYLSAVSKRPEVAGQIRSKEYSEAFFIQTLKDKSLGVWMYLHYIIKEIESGSRAPLDLENLPTGLTGYYADYWDDWRYGRRGRGKGEDAWNTLYSPLLTMLAAAQEAITVEQLIQWSGVNASSREVAHLLVQSWRSFITEKENGKSKVYLPYHLSFRDFVTGRVDFNKLDPKRESLVRDLAEQTVEAHGRIVKAFEEECKSKWENLVAQEYPRLHLSTHLAGAKDYKKLTDIFTEGDEHIQWAKAVYKEKENYADYLASLQTVWAYAYQQKDFALTIRCMLIENSIHSLASNISPELLAQLAKEGLWSYARCLSTIRENSSSASQAFALKLITPNLPTVLLQDALATIREIKNDTYRASAMANLAPYLSKELKKQALHIALEIKDSDVHALSDLAPYLNDEIKTQALATAREINDEYLRGRALSDLAPHLNSELITQALVAAHEINDDYVRSRALAALVPYLNDDLKTVLITESLAAIYKINSEHESARARALAALAPHINDELKTQLIQEAFATTLKIIAEEARVRALAVLAPQLNEELKPQALAAACEIKNQGYRARALADLAPHLNHEQQTRAFFTVLEIKNSAYRAGALSTITPHLNDELKQQALAAICEIKDEFQRVRAFSALAPQLNDDHKAQALAAIFEIKNEMWLAIGLTSFTPYLNDKNRDQALVTAHNIKDVSARTRLLTALAPYLNNEIKLEILQEAVSAAREIKIDYARACALASLAPYLNEELKIEVLEEALSVTRKIKDVSARTRVLVSLLPYLDDEFKEQAIQKALTVAYEIKSAPAQAHAIAALAPYLNCEVKTQALQDALTVACKIKNEDTRVNALTAFAPHLNEKQKAQALNIALEIRDVSIHAHALTSLAPYLNEEQKSHALAFAYKIKYEPARTHALSALAPHLKHQIKAQVFDSISKIKEEDARASVLVSLTPYLNPSQKNQVFFIIKNIKAESIRANFLAAFAQQLNGDLQIQVLREALASTLKTKYKSACANALAAIAPYLDDDMRTQALSAAREIKQKTNRAYVLTSFVPHLNNELRAQVVQEALSAAYKIKNETARVNALLALVPHLSDELKATILQEVLYTLDHQLLSKALDIWKNFEFKGLSESIFSVTKFASQKNREEGAKILATLTPAFIHLLGKGIAGELLRSVLDTARWWP